jgi:hypothetical protein
MEILYKPCLKNLRKNLNLALRRKGGYIPLLLVTSGSLIEINTINYLLTKNKKYWLIIFIALYVST